MRRPRLRVLDRDVALALLDHQIPLGAEGSDSAAFGGSTDLQQVGRVVRLGEVLKRSSGRQDGPRSRPPSTSAQVSDTPAGSPSGKPGIGHRQMLSRRHEVRTFLTDFTPSAKPRSNSAFSSADFASALALASSSGRP
jgi:hypothetical protein